MGEIEREDAAAIARVTRDTFSAYVARGRAPRPVRHIGRTPLWDEDEVRAWMTTRPGRGRHASSRTKSEGTESS